MRKNIILSGIVLSAAVTLSSCGFSKEFVSPNGVTITLDTSFSVLDEPVDGVPSSVYLLLSRNVGFMANRELKSSYSGYSVNQYAKNVLNSNDYSSAEVLSYSDDTTSYEYAYYTASNEGVDFKYMLICKEGTSHFYTMNLYCLEDKFDKYEDKFNKWAKTIIVE